jgi:hypothetical protein
MLMIAVTLAPLLAAHTAYADIKVVPDPPQAAKAATFSDASGAICCTWSFGDGTRDLLQKRSVTHVYQSMGTYDVQASGFFKSTKGQPGERFIDKLRVKVKDSRDPTAPLVAITRLGSITRSGRITARDGGESVRWVLSTSDPESGIKSLRAHLSITAVCRDIMSGSGRPVTKQRVREALPNLFDSKSRRMTLSVTFSDLLATAGGSCEAPLSLQRFVGSVRAEAANGFDAKTVKASAFRYQSRLTLNAYNMGGGTDYLATGNRQHNRKLEGILPRIAEADIAMLQEVRKYPEGPNQVKLITENTPLKYFYWHKPPPTSTGLVPEYGAPGIFSRYPLANGRWIRQPNGSSDTVSVAIAEAEIEGMTHLVMSVHYPHESGDILQRTVGNHIRDEARTFKGPVIIGGDFNSGPEGNGQGNFLRTGHFESANLGDASYAYRRPIDAQPTAPFFTVVTTDPDRGGLGGCDFDEGLLDYIYFRGRSTNFQPILDYRHLVYEQRCSAAPNSNHPLILARLR